MTADGDSRYAVRSVLRIIDILEMLRARPEGATLAELVDVTDMPKSSVFRYLATLEMRGYVVREDSTGIFRLGAAFLTTEAQHLETLARIARPHLQELRDRFEETVNLGVLAGSRAVYLEIVESRRSMRFVARKGDREYIHSTGLGKAISMLLTDEKIRAILESEGMPAPTERTITDPDVFIREMSEIRARGYAIDDGENEPAGRCVAVPLSSGAPLAAISLSAPAARLSDSQARAAVPELIRVAEQISKAVT